MGQQMDTNSKADGYLKLVCGCFYEHFISDTTRNIRQQEFLALEQGQMTIIEYERKFMWVHSFCTDLYFSQATKAMFFQNNLNPRYKDTITGQSLSTLCDVVDSANKLDAKKASKDQVQQKVKVEEKGKTRSLFLQRSSINHKVVVMVVRKGESLN